MTGHSLVVTSSVFTPRVVVPDYGSQLDSSIIASGSLTVLNNTGFLSASLFASQAAAFNTSGTLHFKGDLYVTGSATGNSTTTAKYVTAAVSSSVINFQGDNQVEFLAGTQQIDFFTGNTVTFNSGSVLVQGGLVEWQTANPSSNPYVCDSSVVDNIVFANSPAAPITIDLPKINGIAGRIICVKDIGGQAGTSHITIAAASGNTIEGNLSISISTNYGSYTLVSTSGTAWYIIAKV